MRFRSVWMMAAVAWCAGVALGQEAEGLDPEVASRARVSCTAVAPPTPVGKSMWVPNLWPGGTVPYEFDANVTAANRAAIRQAMDVLEGAAVIHFGVRAGETNYLHIVNSTANNSYVGVQGGGQVVNIFNWNYRYVMCHELMHALGLWHEQSRTDRNTYITVNYANIQGAQAYNYDIQAGATAGAYDFDSVMHYGQFDLSSNGQPTMTVLPPNQAWQTLIGQHTHLSSGDVAGLVSRYGSLTPTAAWALRASTGPSARELSAMCYDAGRGVTVLFGGLTGTSTRNADTWEWNGAAWTQRVAAGPSARYGHALVYDTLRHVCVLFGGNTSSGESNQTWEWNGTAWTQRVIAGPTGREQHGMAYETGLGTVMLFGGLTSATARSGETWEYDGDTWALKSGGGPGARSGMGVSFDPGRLLAEVFGGQTGASTYGNDTWEWTGSTWVHRTTAVAPAARTGAPLAYDAARGVSVLFGGWSGAVANAETWQWNGSAWTQQGPGGPTARHNHVMAYQSGRGTVLLFGGRTGTSTLSGETWELGTPCVQPIIQTNPGDQPVCTGSTATFSVTMTTETGVAFQWRKDGVEIDDVAGHRTGTGTPALSITGAGAADLGTYDCVASNACGFVTSNGAALTLATPAAAPASILVDAGVTTYCAGSPPASIVLRAVGGQQFMTWRRAAGVPASGCGTASLGGGTTLTISPAPTVTTTYYATNSNTCGAQACRALTVTVIAPPPPPGTPTLSGTATLGGAVTMTAAIAGDTSGLTYLWTKDGQPLAQECAGSGRVRACAGVVTVSGLSGTDAGQYCLTLRRGTGVTCSSSTACYTLAVAGYCADIGGPGGVEGADGALDNNDFIVYINQFFAADARADVGMQGGVSGADGVFDNNDFIVYINAFFAGC